MPQAPLFKLDQRPKGRGLRCDSEGLFLAGEALLEREGDARFRPRPAAEIHKVLRSAYRMEADWSSRIRSVRVVADALNKGDLARAMMAAVLMRLPEPDGATGISDVDGVLAKAGYDPEEPRDERGRWTNESDAEEPSPAHGDPEHVKPKPKPPAPPLIDVLGPAAAKIAKLSPTLVRDLQALRNLHWHIEARKNGTGSVTDRSKTTIFVDGNDFGKPGELVQTLSHEVGHALYVYQPDSSSKSAYVNSYLGDEGMATISNIKIEREILAAGGPDIGVPTRNAKNLAAYNAAYDTYLKTGNIVAARNAIGAIYGDGEITSNTGQKYKDYYGDAFEKAYHRH